MSWNGLSSCPVFKVLSQILEDLEFYLPRKCMFLHGMSLAVNCSGYLFFHSFNLQADAVQHSSKPWQLFLGTKLGQSGPAECQGTG